MDNAARLHAAGVTVILKTGSGTAHRARELRYGAGNAVAWGLPHDAAVAAITINPARVFGIADRIGSLEPGRPADLVLWDGDPLERSEEHTSELQSLMRISYAVFCLEKKKTPENKHSE